MFSIGEFSKITGLSIKTLRFYHEKDLLLPSSVDAQTGYRYYDRRNIEKARIITVFRDMEFSLKEIKDILDNYDDQADILDYIEKHKKVIESKVRQLPGGRCACLLHKGPYDQLGRSYAKILEYVKKKGYEIECPTREVYLKGPGMILKGNPKNYLTEIQMLIKE